MTKVIIHPRKRTNVHRIAFLKKKESCTARFYGSRGMMPLTAWYHALSIRGYDVIFCLIPCSFQERSVGRGGYGTLL